MRAVNLLPPADRSKRPVEAPRNAAPFLLGGLAVLLVAVVAFVLSQNQVNSRTTDIARATQEQESAEQRAAALGGFADFAQIKETRLASVRALADSRFDWERLMRELALVLPEKTWIVDASTSATGSPDASGTTAPAAPPATPAASADPAATAARPSVALTGCAPSQTVVAEVISRLRNLHRATEVSLTESGKAADAEGTTTDSAAPAGGTADCGEDYTFKASVTFGAAAPAADPLDGAGEDDRVPATLGGGA